MIDNTENDENTPLTRAEWKRIYKFGLIPGFLLLFVFCLLAIKVSNDSADKITTRNAEQICEGSWQRYEGRLGLRDTFGAFVATIQDPIYHQKFVDIIEDKLPVYPKPDCVRPIP